MCTNVRFDLKDGGDGLPLQEVQLEGTSSQDDVGLNAMHKALSLAEPDSQN